MRGDSYSTDEIRRVIVEQTVEALRWAVLGDGAPHGVLYLRLGESDGSDVVKGLVRALRTGSTRAAVEDAIQAAAEEQADALLRWLARGRDAA